MKRNLTPPTYNKSDLIDFRRPNPWMHSVERHSNLKGSDALKTAIVISLVIVSVLVIKAWI